MVREYYDNICSGVDVRENLICLRDALKSEDNLREFAYLLGGDFTRLCELLSHEDPKVRKNAALVLGEMESEDMLPVLFDAYQKEETLYIRADYLKAMSGLDYRPIADLLEKRLDELRSTSMQSQDWKHLSEEIRILQSMVLRCRGVRSHRFSALKEKKDVILLTNRRFREVTAKQINKGQIRMLSSGVRVNGASIKDVLSIRTYSELLFPLESQEVLCADDPAKCGRELAGPVLGLADQIYNGGGAYIFRIELRGGDENKSNEGHSDLFTAGSYSEKKGAYLRKITDALEYESGARLINSVTDYELEIRLVLRKDGSFAAMLKPSSNFDERFAYRRDVIPSSISPVNAALTAQLSMEYLTENAQVLDPFCGVGTMLIERDLAVKAGTMYGIDISGEAIDKARKNTARSGCKINYINRDFFTFRHNYLFDEVITDMPRQIGDGSKKAQRCLYHDFFDYVRGLLKEKAVLVLYSSVPNYVVESVRMTPGYKIVHNYLLNEKNGTAVMIILWEKPNT